MSKAARIRSSRSRTALLGKRIKRRMFWEAGQPWENTEAYDAEQTVEGVMEPPVCPQCQADTLNGEKCQTSTGKRVRGNGGYHKEAPRS